MITPINAITMMPYKGKNQDILTNFMISNGFTDAKFATLRQWNKLGRCLLRGSKSCSIAWVDLYNKNREYGYNYKRHTLFNVAQTRPFTDEEVKKFEEKKNVI